MLIRSLAKTLRGRATPFQVVSAGALGSMLGFLPGFANAPGLVVGLGLLLILLNANLGIAALVGMVAKPASLLMAPVSFAAGRALLDGPTQPIFRWLINAPVFALFGFERYLTTGAAAIGLIVGVGVGVGIVALLAAFRRRMAGLEESSEAYKRISARWWARLLVFLCVGKGHGKATYAQLLVQRRKWGLPIRPLGLALVVLFVGLLWLTQQFLSGPILTAALVRGLERANGASVDLAEARIDLRAGKLSIARLAMADPNDLSTDLFRAASLEADISGADLLRGRVGLDNLVIIDASSGAPRRTPGRIVGRPPTPTPAPPAEGEEKSIEDYLNQAKVWKERLAQARRWLDSISGPASPPLTPPTPGQPTETLRERLEREVRDKGYAFVKADHLIEGAPTFLVRDLLAQGITASQLPGEVLDVHAVNLSTHPHLVAGSARIEVRSRSGNLLADVSLARSGGAAAEESGLRLSYKGVSADAIGSALAVGGKSPIRGGTADLDLRAGWENGRVGFIKAPLEVTLRDTTLSAPGGRGGGLGGGLGGGDGGGIAVKELSLPIGLRGPIDNPRITIDADRLADALVKAGAGALVEKGKREAEKVIDKAAGKALDKLGGGGLGGLLGGEKEKKKKP